MSALITAFGIDWHLLFANAVNFIVLAALLTWLLYKPVMKMVAEREAVVGASPEGRAETRRSGGARWGVSGGAARALPLTVTVRREGFEPSRPVKAGSI